MRAREIVVYALEYYTRLKDGTPSYLVQIQT